MYRFDANGQLTMLELEAAEGAGLRPSADQANRTPNWFRSRISTWIWYLVLSTSSGSATGSSDLHGVKGNAPSIPGLPPVVRSESRSPAYWRQTRRKSIICRKSPALASCAEPLSAERSCPKSWNGH